MPIEKIDVAAAYLARRNTASLRLWLRLDHASNERGMVPQKVVELVALFRRRYGDPEPIVKDAAEDAIRRHVYLEGAEAHATS